jgi:hypothetical protein
MFSHALQKSRNRMYKKNIHMQHLNVVSIPKCNVLSSSALVIAVSQVLDAKLWIRLFTETSFHSTSIFSIEIWTYRKTKSTIRKSLKYWIGTNIIHWLHTCTWFRPLKDMDIHINPHIRTNRNIHIRYIYTIRYTYISRIVRKQEKPTDVIWHMWSTTVSSLTQPNITGLKKL